MRFAFLLSGLLLASGLAPLGAAAQSFSANYDLTRAQPAAFTERELAPGATLLTAGPVRLSTAVGRGVAGGTGGGLSLEAGQTWFARVGLGTALDNEVLSLGAGYRWRDGQSVSMQFLRSRGQDRVGLAVRYDWPQYYLRLSYDPRWGDTAPDMLRFSAGMRF
ncbi:hypothetical protein [Ramlibacter sp.]|uniref:hypothetical protein n=1 Tax=Ramlibacter sp. TaxID=1917967 RepID=UPI003D106A60